MEDRDAPVVLRNTLRRPLIFRVAGRTVRLSPGEELKVPEAWLASSELQHFRGSGLLDARLPEKAAAGGRKPDADDPEGGAEGDEPDDDDREAKRERAKSAKAKKPKPEN
jgi:hypothetical protein